MRSLILDFSPVIGFTLVCLGPLKESMEKSCDGKERNTTFTSLKCGTRYEMIITASNSVGKSERSEPIIVRTSGSG